MDEQYRDYDEEHYWANFCPECGDSPCGCDETAELAAEISYCPACGSPIDYCQGHGEIGDPAGRAILRDHDHGYHSHCHPDGCDLSGMMG